MQTSFPLIPDPSRWEVDAPEAAADDLKAIELATAVAALCPAALATFVEELTTRSPRAVEVLKFSLLD